MDLGCSLVVREVVWVVDFPGRLADIASEVWLRELAGAWVLTVESESDWYCFSNKLRNWPFYCQ